MAENQTPQPVEKRSWAFSVLTGGWKRWLLIGPLALLLLGTVAFFAQPIVAFSWRWMTLIIYLAALTTGFTFTRMSTKLKVTAGIAGGITGVLLLLSYGIEFAPFVGICAAAATLPWLTNYIAGVRILGVLAPLSKVALGAMAVWLLLANTVPAIQQWQLADYIVSHTDELQVFPVTIDDRVLPRATATEYSLKANEDRTKEVERVHILWLPKGTGTALDTNDQTVLPSNEPRCVWQAPLKFNPNVTANKFWYSFWGSVEGVIRIDGSEIQMKADQTSGSGAYFMFGADSWVTSAIFKLRHPLSTPAQNVYWEKTDGSWVILKSYVSYKPTWTGTMIPVMGGVMEFGSHGAFVNHSPKEAKQLFNGATLFPPDLAREYSQAYAKFRFGLNDYFWNQKGLLEISEDENEKDVYPTKNAHPYYQNFEAFGPQLVMPFEPMGDTAHALTRVLLFDAVSGEIKGFTRKGGNTINAPRTGLLNLAEAAPELKWDQYASVEPLIIHTASGKWYYKVSVIKDGAGHSTVRVILVDAVTLRPIAFENVRDYQRFLKDGTEPAGFVPHSKPLAPESVPVQEPKK